MPEDNSASPTDVNASMAPVADTQATAPSEASTEETKELEVVHEGKPVNASQMQDEVQEDKGSDNSETREQEESNQEESNTEDQPQEDKKRDANTRIRQLNAENKDLRYQLKEALGRKNPGFDVDKAINDGADPSDARLDALEQREDYRDYTQAITELNVQLNQETHDVEQDFPYMDSSNPNRSQEDIDFANQVTDLWFQASDAQFEEDPTTGDKYFTQAKVPLYDFVKKMDGIRNSGRSSGVREGQVNAERQLASVEIPTGPAPKTDRSNDASLSAEAYAEKYKLDVVGG